MLAGDASVIDSLTGRKKIRNEDAEDAEMGNDKGDEIGPG
jgi:hypothetical protein